MARAFLRAVSPFLATWQEPVVSRSGLAPRQFFSRRRRGSDERRNGPSRQTVIDKLRYHWRVAKGLLTISRKAREPQSADDPNE